MTLIACFGYHFAVEQYSINAFEGQRGLINERSLTAHACVITADLYSKELH